MRECLVGEVEARERGDLLDNFVGVTGSRAKETCSLLCFFGFGLGVVSSVIREELAIISFGPVSAKLKSIDNAAARLRLRFADVADTSLAGINAPRPCEDEVLASEVNLPREAWRLRVSRRHT